MQGQSEAALQIVTCNLKFEKKFDCLQNPFTDIQSQLRMALSLELATFINDSTKSRSSNLANHSYKNTCP